MISRPSKSNYTLSNNQVNLPEVQGHTAFCWLTRSQFKHQYMELQVEAASSCSPSTWIRCHWVHLSFRLSMSLSRHSLFFELSALLHHPMPKIDTFNCVSLRYLAISFLLCVLDKKIILWFSCGWQKSNESNVIQLLNTFRSDARLLPFLMSLVCYL